MYPWIKIGDVILNTNKINIVQRIGSKVYVYLQGENTFTFSGDEASMLWDKFVEYGLVEIEIII